MAKVVLDHIRKEYENGFVAVHDASFEINDGEFVVLVGPSGCGKSTTLRMIAGLESITSGALSIGERVVNDVAPKDRDIAMVFQNYALYPHMTVYENMAFGLKLRKFVKKEIEERVHQAAEILGIRSILDRKPKQLSGGQRQRVALGRAIVRDPQVFLFDEPLSNLDAKLRVQMRTEIARLHAQLKATMIYVTHDQVEAMTMGDRIVVLKDGVVQQIDTPLNLYNKPDNQFVAGFIGSPSMNFIKGTVVREGAPQFVAEAEAFHFDFRGKVPGTAEGVVMGIRPEDIRIETPSVDSDDIIVEVDIDVVEPMGNEIFVYAHAGPHPLVARVAPQHVPMVGSKVSFSFETHKLHFFDVESGETLRLP